MTNTENSNKSIPDSGFALENIARWFSYFFILVIFLLSVFGRNVVDYFTLIKYIAPLIGLVFISVIVLSILKLPIDRKQKIWPNFQSKALTSTFSITVLTGCIILSELLIVDPIERIHFVKYGLLTMVIFCAQVSERPIKKLLPAALLAFSVGALDESLQYFVPNRVFDLRDIVLNLTGAGFGTIFIWLALLWKNELSGQN